MKTIMSKYAGECAATECKHFNRHIKSGKRVAWDGSRIYHEDCEPRVETAQEFVAALDDEMKDELGVGWPQR